VIVKRTASAAFSVTFESEQELREEHRVNLSASALSLPSSETFPLHTKLLVTLLGPWGGEAFVQATVVAPLPNIIALAIEGDVGEIFGRLMVRRGVEAGVEDGGEVGGEVGGESSGEEDGTDGTDGTSGTDGDEGGGKQTVWDRVRGLSQMEKLLLAVKADRSERALLLQDNDPRVLLSLLRNPRLTVDEVARIAKSSFLTFQVADAIAKTSQWMAGVEVRIALVRNPKTPPTIALAILPLLPDSEIRTIARTGTNMALKQAALRRLQGRI